MSDDFLNELHLTDPWIAAITTERIKAALADFRLPFADGWDFVRLTRAIQDMANAARGDAPQGDAEAIKELEKLAARARNLRQAISRMGETAEIAAFFEALRHLGENRNASSIDYDTDYKPLMLAPLETIANILSRAGSQLKTRRTQSTRWRERHGKEQRIGFAVSLIPVFQDAFDTPARATNWGAEYGEEHPWPDFYRRIYLALFPDAERLNLAEVLQAAARELPHVEAMKRWLAEQDAIRPKNTFE